MAFGSISVDRITSSDYTLIDNYIADSGRPLSNRNLIINGAMQVAQRGNSNTGITTTGYYTADRWRIFIDSAGTWTMNVESSAPANTEFRKSANVICTTADSSLSADDQYTFNHRFEAQNLQGIKKGTADAESLTLSFYVKSSNTGTYICELRDEDNSRQISKSYTINTANTWEKKTLTFPPDTTGQFDNDNELGLTLNFWLAAGSNRSSGTLNSSAWASITDANRAVGQLNLANATGNYWAVTGVQLEIGTVATPFERRPYGTEFDLCRRYYERFSGASSFICTSAAYNTNDIYGGLNYYEKRATPTFTAVGGSNTFTVFGNATSVGRQASNLIFQDFNLKNVRVGTDGGGYTTGYAYFLQFYNGTASYIEVSSEL